MPSGVRVAGLVFVSGAKADNYFQYIGNVDIYHRSIVDTGWLPDDTGKEQ